jgi:hypothetical protein
MLDDKGQCHLEHILVLSGSSAIDAVPSFQLSLANAPLAGRFDFSGGPGARIPVFLLPSKREGMERREAPERCATPPFGGRLTDVRRAPTANTLLPRAAAYGVRAPIDGRGCASRGSTAAPLSGTAPRAVSKRPYR